MSENRRVTVKDATGNRFSLRAKAADQIKRVDLPIGPLKDVLVTTWGGVLKGIVIGGGVGFLVLRALTINGGATLVDNIVPVILMIAGGALIAVNAMLTNPAKGSQLVVSLKFLVQRYKRGRQGKGQRDWRPFYFDPDDPHKEILIGNYRGKRVFLAAYTVRGSISPVTFDADLQFIGELNHQFIGLMERDTVVNTVNAIKNNQIKPIELPRNATPKMIEKQQEIYKIGNVGANNQKLETTVVFCTRTKNRLRHVVEAAERKYDQGMVVGYMRLGGRDLKARMKDILG